MVRVLVISAKNKTGLWEMFCVKYDHVVLYIEFFFLNTVS